MSTVSTGLSTPPANMPTPMGVIAETGQTHPPLTEKDLLHIAPDSAAALAKANPPKTMAVSSSVDDPMDLTQTGWGVLFASDVDPAIRAALQPLLDLRKAQVNNDKLFQIFEGPTGVRPGQTIASWAMSRGVTLVAPVNPLRGVPYYLLIVGSPKRISFEFQAQLDLQWAVGRLYFDKVEDYAAYAQKVVDYEKAATVSRRKNAAVWMPRNPLDTSTPMLAGTIGGDFLGQTNPGNLTLGQRQKFQLKAFIGDGQATKQCLTDVLTGQGASGNPSVVFTGSHGAEWAISDPDIQRQRQGALVTQEWTRGQPLTDVNYFAGSDLSSSAKLDGTMVFMFACFSGGCPDSDSYAFAPDGSKVPLAPEPLVANLPQALLSRGALAVFAHVDRAFSYDFEDVVGTPQSELMRTPLELLMKGQRAGMAADTFNLQWSSLASQLGVLLGGNHDLTTQPPPAVVANLYIARDDARNYTVLGDPAVRLRTELMG